MKWFDTRSLALASMGLILSGCVPGPQLTGDGSYAANTSHAFRENRVFYLGLPKKVCKHGDCPSTCTSTGCVAVRPLSPVYEPPANPADSIKHGDPLSVLVSGVRIPETVSGPVDVAVVLDIYTGKDPEQQSTALVVWYQRDVRGGMTLAFQNLVVYSVDFWNSDYPPLFRLRVLDVKTERNTATASLLDNASQIASSFGDFLPSTALPILSLATKTAKLILANQQNQVLIDYTVQFYSQPFVDATGNRADVASLQRGSWMVVGLPAGQPSRFWRSPLLYDRKTQELLDARDIPESPPPATRVSDSPTRPGIQSPYINMTVVPYSTQVYALVHERSQALTRLLTARDQQDLTQVDQLGTELSKSVRTFVLLRNLRRERSVAAVDRLILAFFKDAVKLDEAAVRAELRRVLPQDQSSLADGPVADLNTWWSKEMKHYTFNKETYRLELLTPAKPK